MTDKSQEQQEQPNEEAEERRTWPIVCTLCGEKARVPFRPKKDHDPYCPDCFKFKKKDVEKKRQKRAPRRKHGTRVHFPIECAQCGAEEVLDYVPKGVSLSEVLCSDCVRTTYGEESRWAKVKERKKEEQKGEWEFDCTDCGRRDYLKFQPKPDKDYLCVRCYNLQESPSPDRLQGKKRVGRAVYIRKSDDS